MRGGDLVLQVMLIKLVAKKRTYEFSIKELKEEMGRLLHIPTEYKMGMINYMVTSHLMASLGKGRYLVDCKSLKI